MHHQGFERLIRAMDEVAAALTENVVMQLGASSFLPVHSEWFRFADETRMETLYKSSAVIVSHAGAGTIISAFRLSRPLVIVPRRSEHGEHVDDHQLELATALSEQGKVVAVLDPAPVELNEAIQKVRSTSHSFSPGSASLAQAIDRLLHQV